MFPVVVGFTLIAVGVILPFTRDSGATGFQWQLLVGAVVVALGGAYLSWVASLHAARQAAEVNVRRETADRLDPITRGIGQKSGQVIETINRGMQQDIESDTALEIMYQLTRAIQADVVELTAIAGTPYDKNPTIEAIALMDELARDLGSATPADLALKIERLRSTVGAQVAATYTAGVTPSAPSAKRRESLLCPNCGNPVPVMVRTNQAATDAVCVTCYHSLSVSFPELAVTVRGPLDVRNPSPILGRNGSRPVVACHVCDRSITSQIVVDDRLIGLCRKDRTAEVVTRDAFETWRSGHQS